MEKLPRRLVQAVACWPRVAGRRVEVASIGGRFAWAPQGVAASDFGLPLCWWCAWRHTQNFPFSPSNVGGASTIRPGSVASWFPESWSASLGVLQLSVCVGRDLEGIRRLMVQWWERTRRKGAAPTNANRYHKKILKFETKKEIK